MSDDWFIEKHTPSAGLTLAVGERLFDRQSQFQHIEVLDTLEYGRMLLLDGFVMLTDRDEFVYHEMIVHPALLTHGDPRRVLVIGGGDGGTVREALRHETVERVTLVEIDAEVIETSRRFFPALSAGLDDPRVAIECQDGFAYLEHHPGAFDAIIVDSIDPVGEAAKLFTSAFYARVKAALRPAGIAVFQTESPFYNGEVLAQAVDRLSPFFAHVAPFLAHVPTYPSGLWSFTCASQGADPRTVILEREPPFLADLRYFNFRVFQAAFALPNYIQQTLPG